MNITTKCFRALIVTCCFILAMQVDTQAAVAQSNNDKINTILTETYPDEKPGAVVVIIEGGEVVFEKLYGMADIEKGVRITPDMSFRIGSLTKQFTAAAIMKLVENGQIKVNDPISKYLPGLIKNDDVITVENLLTHTSGIGNFENLEKTSMDAAGRDLNLSDILNFFIDQPPEFEVGTKYQYSNPGYILLGAIIEKVSGVSYAQFLRKEVLGPLKMDSTYFDHHKPESVIRVQGYHREDGGIINAFRFNADLPRAAGGLSSTAGDLQIWGEALWSGKVVSQQLLKQMTTPYALLDGSLTQYGYGLEVLKVKNKPFIAHQGGIFGFQSFLATLPEQDIQIIILTNTDNPETWPSEVADRIIDILLD